MKVTQIYSLLNSINKQMWGQEAQSVKDLSGVISMGKNVLSTENNTDLFLNKLVDRIGKTVIRTLDLQLEFPSLYMNEFEGLVQSQKDNCKPV